ncbi:MAG: metallophosphoesterase family protein [Candidatus Heimdallarchaeaceae archaeon]
MKLGILGDLHLTNRGPRRRLDNYFETQIDKLKQALNIFDREKCSHIIQVGDFFESPDTGNYVISTIISLLRSRNIKILCCYGQHDISGHNAFTLKRSPLKVLESAGVVKILSKDPVQLANNVVGDDKRYLMMYAASFGEKVPETDANDPYNILVTHRMIGDKSLYPGQELTSPRKFLRDNPNYNVVFCGDYHYRFQDVYQGRTIVNPGCLMRKTIGKFDLEHQPGVTIFDVNKDKDGLSLFLLKVKTIEEIFDLEKAGKKDNKKLLEFIENLRENNESDVDWKRNLVRVLSERKSSKEVKDIISRILSKVKGEK